MLKTIIVAANAGPLSRSPPAGGLPKEAMVEFLMRRKNTREYKFFRVEGFFDSVQIGSWARRNRKRPYLGQSRGTLCRIAVMQCYPVARAAGISTIPEKQRSTDCNGISERLTPADCCAQLIYVIGPKDALWPLITAALVITAATADIVVCCPRR